MGAFSEHNIENPRMKKRDLNNSSKKTSYASINPYTEQRDYKIVSTAHSTNSTNNFCLSLRDAVKSTLINPKNRIAHALSNKEIPEFSTGLNTNPFFVAILKSENPLGILYKNLDFILNILDREMFLDFFREKNIETNYFLDTSAPYIWARSIIDSYIGVTSPNYSRLIELLNFLFEKTKDRECDLWFDAKEAPFNILCGDDGTITHARWIKFRNHLKVQEDPILGFASTTTEEEVAYTELSFELYAGILEVANYVHQVMKRREEQKKHNQSQLH